MGGFGDLEDVQRSFPFESICELWLSNQPGNSDSHWVTLSLPSDPAADVERQKTVFSLECSYWRLQENLRSGGKPVQRAPDARVCNRETTGQTSSDRRLYSTLFRSRLRDSEVPMLQTMEFSFDRRLQLRCSTCNIP
jgi:hypothetical protein